MNFLSDLRLAVRNMQRNASFAATAMITLALGIGATTAVFTIVNAILIQPLSYQDPARLVRIGSATVARAEMLVQAKAFLEAGAYQLNLGTATLIGKEGPEPLKSARVSANFMRILGVNPIRGRSFRPAEEKPGPEAAMISAELWESHFAGDPEILNQRVVIDGLSTSIVGILPPGFQFPAAGIEVWRTFQPAQLTEPSRTNSPILNIIARLKPGVTLDQANAELQGIQHQYRLEHPGKLDARPNQQAIAVPLKDHLVNSSRETLWMVFGAATFLLLIACANVASLLFARATARTREFAVRAALGADRRRIITQLLAESLLLAGGGSVLGLFLARWSVAGIVKLPGLELPRLQEIRVDGSVLIFTVLLCVVTTLLFGLAPALGASQPDLSSVIKAGTVGAAKRIVLWLTPRGLLVAGQIALSLVLLIGAALLIESLVKLRRVDPGFQTSNLLTMRIGLPVDKHPELIRRVEALPGVRNAAVTFTLPLTGYAMTPVQVAGQPPLKLNERPFAIIQTVSPGYFKTLAVPMKRGRDVSFRDTAASPLIAVVNESLARKFWPAYPQGQDPIGQRILIGAFPQPVEIVGVAADVHQEGLGEQPSPALFRPRTQTMPFPAMFAVRTDGNPNHLVKAIRAEVAAIDPNQTIAEVKTMDEILEESEGKRKSIMMLLELFAGVGLALAAVGIYGVIAYSMAQRTKEIGIRRALGAQRSDVIRLVLGQALTLAALGAAVGVAAAFAVTRSLKSLLFGVSQTDPVVFTGITVLLMVVALTASYIPARRAARVDPATSLRVG